MGGSSKTTSTQTYDPAVVALKTNAYNDAKAFAAQPTKAYTGQLVADFNPTQLQAKSLFQNIANDQTGASTLNQAKDAYGGLLNFNAQNVSAGSYNPALSSFTGYTPSQAAYQGVDASQLANADLSKYLNPYTQNVIDSSLSDLARQRAIQRVSDNQSATAARAFGGSRQGVADSLTNDAYLRNVGSLTANLRNTGYQNAQNAALSDIAAQNNFKQFNAGNQFAANQFNANANNTAGQFNSTGMYNASLNNANAQNAASQFNIGTALDASKTNAANDIASAGVQGNAANNLAGLSDQELSQALRRALGIGAVGDAEQANTQAGLTANYNEFLRQIQDEYQRQALAQSALSGVPMNSTNTQTQSSSPGLLGILGTGLSAASLFV